MKNKYVNVLLAAVIAFGLWLYVVTVVSPNQSKEYYNVSVILEGETVLKDRGLMLLSGQNPTVKLELYGSRQNLNNIDASNLTLKADLTSIYDAGTYELEYTISYPGSIPANSVSTQNKDPDTVTVIVAERDTTQIPVQVGYVGKEPDDFIVDKTLAVLDYEFVTITGPKEVVEKIDHAYIEVDLTDRTESISESYRYILRDANGEAVDAQFITTNVEEVRFELPIQRMKTIPLKVTVVDGGGATEQSSSITIDPIEISVSGSDVALEKLDELVIGTINLADISASTTREFDIVMPEGVTNRSGVTTAKVSISFPELSKKEFTITDIRTLNVPEGMAAELVTKQLVVTVRGPKEDIAKLQISDITVTVDLAGVENTAVVEPVITFSDEFPNVGAVGKYSISVTVAEPPEPTEE